MITEEDTLCWLPMSDAPTDETIIFTDCGVAMWRDSRWVICDFSGNAPSCADWGYEISEIEPTAWIPLEDVLSKIQEKS